MAKKKTNCVIPCGMCGSGIEFEFDEDMDEWQSSDEVFHHIVPYFKGKRIQEKDKFFCDADCCARYFADNDTYSFDKSELESAGGKFS